MSRARCHRFLEPLLHGEDRSFLPDHVYGSRQGTHSAVQHWGWTQRLWLRVRKVEGGYEVRRVQS